MLVLRTRSRYTVVNVSAQNVKHRWFSDIQKEPLRILFCGSDEFSATSLERLHFEHAQNPKLIESIDVVCKAGKPSGRGLKKVREVPLKRIAAALELPVHEISTFTGWQPPIGPLQEPINLIIAVSFGLLVPERILKGAAYGGLNVHPSLLPEFRGPAPLQHTLLQGRRTSGITVQTLHPKHFDHGLILAQAPFDVPNEGDCSHEELVNYVKPQAADLLIETLRKALYRSRTSTVAEAGLRSPSHAPKLTRDNARVDWKNWPAEQILRTQRANEPLWNFACDLAGYDGPKASMKDLRIQWHGLNMEKAHEAPTLLEGGSLDTFSDNIKKAGVWTEDGHFLTAQSLTIAGRPKHQDAVRAINFLRKSLVSPKEWGIQKETKTVQCGYTTAAETWTVLLSRTHRTKDALCSG